MLFIAIALTAALVLAGLVTAYVAFPHRGEAIPRAEWLSDLMTRSRRAVNDKLADLEERVDERRNHS